MPAYVTIAAKIDASRAPLTASELEARLAHHPKPSRPRPQEVTPTPTTPRTSSEDDTPSLIHHLTGRGLLAADIDAAEERDVCLQAALSLPCSVVLATAMELLLDDLLSSPPLPAGRYSSRTSRESRTLVSMSSKPVFG